MIPLRDHTKSGTFPLMTYLIIAVNTLVFVLMLGLSDAEMEAFVNQYALIPNLVIHGHRLYTLITSMFLHGGFAHIIGNMLFLNIFGDNLEDRLGHLKYLIWYLGCGLAASILQISVDPASTIPNLGASGAIAGVMGGYLLLFPREPIDILFSFGLYMRQTTLPAYTMLFYWFGLQLLTGFGSLGLGDAVSGGVAYFAHIGGFAFGYLSLLPFKSRLLVKDPWV